MNKRFLVVISLFIAVLIFSIAKCSLKVIKSNSCWQKPIKEQADRYYFLFDSIAIKDLENVYSFGNYEIGNYTYVYNYKNEFRFVILEYKSLGIIDPLMIKNFEMDFEINSNEINPSAGCDLGWGPDLKIKTDVCVDFNSMMSIYFDNGTHPLIVDSLDSRSFSGVFKNILIKNENNDNQMLFKFDKYIDTPSRITFYRINKSFYIILINVNNTNVYLKDGVRLLKILPTPNT